MLHRILECLQANPPTHRLTRPRCHTTGTEVGELGHWELSIMCSSDLIKIIQILIHQFIQVLCRNMEARSCQRKETRNYYFYLRLLDILRRSGILILAIFDFISQNKSSTNLPFCTTNKPDRRADWVQWTWTWTMVCQLWKRVWIVK